jgi:hypothetical protein
MTPASATSTLLLLFMLLLLLLLPGVPEHAGQAALTEGQGVLGPGLLHAHTLRQRSHHR